MTALARFSVAAILMTCSTAGFAQPPARDTLAFPLVYQGTESANGKTTSLKFIIQENRQVLMYDAVNPKPVQGYCEMKNGRVKFVFASYLYEGAERNNVITGQAEMTADAFKQPKGWAFQVERQTAKALPSLAGKKMEGVEDKGNAVAFRFLDASQAEMIDKGGVSQGTYTLVGDRLTLRFQRGNFIYEGRFDGRTFAGTARYDFGGVHWPFQVTVK
ncbi:MAG: hypothetical protein U0744_15060 [Gemmataceae bacterium]